MNRRGFFGLLAGMLAIKATPKLAYSPMGEPCEYTVCDRLKSSVVPGIYLDGYGPKYKYPTMQDAMNAGGTDSTIYCIC